MFFLDSELSDGCIDFTMLYVFSCVCIQGNSRNNDSIFNFVSFSVGISGQNLENVIQRSS